MMQTICHIYIVINCFDTLICHTDLPPPQELYTVFLWYFVSYNEEDFFFQCMQLLFVLMMFEITIHKKCVI